MDVEKK
jgi:hypothetical protein